ncbi:MAG TPA: hydroxymethylbilane synthase, partial [Chloroflexota bacterium]
MGRSVFPIATRGSALALRQAEEVQRALQQRFPRLSFPLVRVASEGDLRPDVSLRVLGGQGVFVKAVERALLDGDAAIAVHSLKDVPGEEGPGLTIAAVPPRSDPRDALISPWGSLARVPAGGRIATGSARRAAQLLRARPDLRVVDIRGNVDTRLRKLRDEGLDGLVLALAGLRR